MRTYSYGWCNVGVAFLSMAFAPAVMAFFTLGVYMPVLEAEFHWTRTQISAASTIGTLSAAVLTPYIGRVVDAIGVRTILLAAFATFSCVFCSFYFLSSSLIYFYMGFVLIGATAPVVTLSYTRTVVAWFDRNRGIALGIAMTGSGIGAGLLPPLANYLIEQFGWRCSYLGLGVLAGLISIPLVALFLREHPASATEAYSPNEPNVRGANYGMLRTEAIRTENFWLLIAIFMTVAVSLHGLITHFVPILIDVGLSPSEAAGFMALFGFAVVLGRLACGLLVDRVFAPHVASSMFVLSAVGLTPLFGEPQPFSIGVSTFLIGISIGAETDMLGYLVARYFGFLSFGELYGYVFSSFMVGTSIGPIVLGITFDATTSYHAGLVLVIALLLLSSGLCMRLKAFPEWRREVTGLK